MTKHASKRFLEVGISPKVGPGGWDCNCCAPPKGRRRSMFRRIRRKSKQDLQEEVSEILSECGEKTDFALSRVVVRQ